VIEDVTDDVTEVVVVGVGVKSVVTVFEGVIVLVGVILTVGV
jgi:hypothetical protein